MTHLDIEKEKRDFEAWARKELAMPSALPFNWDADWVKAALEGYLAARRASLQAPPPEVLTIPAAIMNLPFDDRQHDEYKRGHRDARHAAADLVLERADALAALGRASLQADEGKGAVRFGCHCDLEPDMEPDECVIGTDLEGLCVYARRHQTKEACEYWRPIKFNAAITAKEGQNP